MLGEKLLRERPDEVRAGLRRRHAGAEAERDLDRWRALDAERREAATRHDDLARVAAQARRGAHAPSTEEARARARARERRAAAEALGALEARLREVALRLPTLPDPRVPEGDGPAANVVLRHWGEPPALDFAPRTHDELAAALGILDLPRATKLAGTRFPLLLGMGARLGRAFAGLMLELPARPGFIPGAPPPLFRPRTFEGPPTT